jgi:hypothetical protein
MFNVVVMDFFSLRQYMLDILDCAGMAECKPCSTPIDTNPKVAAAPVSDASDFHSLARVLKYLTFTRPDIAYAVQQVCLHMHDPPCAPLHSTQADTSLHSRHSSPWSLAATVYIDCERIKMPKRGVNWTFLKFIARIKSY